MADNVRLYHVEVVRALGVVKVLEDADQQIVGDFLRRIIKIIKQAGVVLGVCSCKGSA